VEAFAGLGKKEGVRAGERQFARDNKPIGDKMILNAAFLLQREREAEFDDAVNRIARKFGERLNFKYTGPWPPYNFVNIRLKLEPSSTA